MNGQLTWHVSLGAEATYHFQLGESYSLVKCVFRAGVTADSGAT